MAISVSVTFLLIFRNSYVLEHFLVAALVYSCNTTFRPFRNFFKYMSEYKDEYFIYD